MSIQCSRMNSLGTKLDDCVSILVKEVHILFKQHFTQEIQIFQEALL